MAHQKSFWLLQANDHQPAWDRPWDKMHGAVVRALNEKVAREIVASAAMDESTLGLGNPWLDHLQTSCTRLHDYDSEMLILAHVVNG